MRAKILKLAIVLRLGCLIDISCANEPEGPGMTVTYYGTMKNVSIFIKNAQLPSGKEFPTAVSFGYAKNALVGGKTEGAAPDGRQLPEWLDFEWQEIPYPFLKQGPNQSYNEFSKLIDAQNRTLPVKAQRVLIRSRVPEDVVDEVIESNRNRPLHKLSEKSLWVEFIWTDSGIKFHWRLWYRPDGGLQSFPREGGDDIPFS